MFNVLIKANIRKLLMRFESEDFKMGNEKIDQIKRSSGITAKVLKVLIVITKISAIICLVGTIICLAGMFVTKEGVLFQSENVRVLLPTPSDIDTSGGFSIVRDLEIENTMLWAAANCFVAVVLLVVLTIFLTLIRNVFNEISESDTPFTESILKRLKIAGIILTLFVLQESLVGAAITGLTVWCIYSVFEYGIELQKNEDETL